MNRDMRHSDAEKSGVHRRMLFRYFYFKASAVCGCSFFIWRIFSCTFFSSVL